MHDEPHPLAGKAIKATGRYEGRVFTIEDWQDRLCDEPWRECSGQGSACAIYRSRRAGLPDDNEVVLCVDVSGHPAALHVSEIAGEVTDFSIGAMVDEDFKAAIGKQVEYNGFALISDYDKDTEMFTYLTVGCADHGMPDLMFYAKSQPAISGLLLQTILGRFISDGFTPVYSNPDGPQKIRFDDVNWEHRVLDNYHRRYYAADVKWSLKQAIMTDEQGHFPEDPRCDPDFVCPLHTKMVN